MKNKSRLLVSALLTVFIAFYAGANAFRSEMIGTIMSASEAKKLWGEKPFDEAKFRMGTAPERAAMASDLIEKKKFVGVPIDAIESKLGKSTGYFWNDSIPSYILNEGWKTDSDVWQLVFLSDRDKRVREVLINKNCCDKKNPR